MARLSPAGLLLLATIAVQAGEVQHAQVAHRDGEFSVDISVKIDGDRDIIYAIATDYKQLARLSDLIVEAGLITHTDQDGNPVIRRRMVTKSCILKFCFDAILVEDLWEPESGIIRSVFVPEHSDFIYGEAVWHVSKIDDSHTMVNFNSRFKPAFWFPPLIGPIFIKRMMLDAARQTIQNIEDLATVETPRP